MRVARGIPRARQVHLLELLQPLREELEDAPVYEVGGRQQQRQVGIARSTLGHVCQFLARHLDRRELETFVSQLERLDFATGQNLDNPAGQHEALKRILETFLKAHPRLEGAELFYVLSWARRFLKDEVRRVESRDSPPSPPMQPPAPVGKTAIEMAILEAQQKRERKNR